MVFVKIFMLSLKKNNYDVLLDDRSERPGIKFSDADLIGIPIQIIVGKNFIENKEISVKIRKDLKESTVSSDNIIELFKKIESLMVTFFEIWVSLKYLLPKTKEKFFSIITIFSFVGISLGVATLIIVMSVMNGFRDELTNKILGVNGHLKLQHFNNLKINNNDSLNEIIK